MLFQEKLSEFWVWILRVCTRIQAESGDLNYLIPYIYTSLPVSFCVIYERKKEFEKEKKHSEERKKA